MAKLSEKSPLNGLKGTLANITFKGTGDGITTVVTAKPNMRKVKPSPLQALFRGDFSEAVKYAQSITRHPDKKAAYAAKLPKGKRPYNAAISEYLRKNGKV